MDIAVPYFLARPSAAPPWPGVVVVMEGNGVSVQLLGVCERLAAEGYAAIAPDLFWRFGGSGTGDFMDYMSRLGTEDVLDDLSFTIAELRRAGAERVGITGFCRGGFYAYMAATHGLDLQAAAPFYGGGIAQELGAPSCPLLAFFGARDEYISTDDIDAVVAHHPGLVVVYDDAGHGFMRDGSDSYVESAATDAWSRLLTFFDEHLKSSMRA